MEWSDQYCFVLSHKVRAIPVCLICNNTVTIIRCGNLKRHCKTTRKDFHTTFLSDCETRKDKLHLCKLSYTNITTTLIWCMSEQEKSTEATLRLSWSLNKLHKPFTDFEVVRECMLHVATTLFNENIINSI